MSDAVVYLAFANPAMTEPDTMAFIACRACRNKTYTITKDQPDGFPLVRCCCCGAHIGRIGWTDSD